MLTSSGALLAAASSTTTSLNVCVPTPRGAVTVGVGPSAGSGVPADDEQVPGALRGSERLAASRPCKRDCPPDFTGDKHKPQRWYWRGHQHHGRTINRCHAARRCSGQDSAPEDPCPFQCLRAKVELHIALGDGKDRDPNSNTGWQRLIQQDDNTPHESGIIGVHDDPGLAGGGKTYANTQRNDRIEKP
jgi:hypothetical protein